MTTLFASSVAHALENVCETLTSHDAKDFAAICGGFEQAGYAVGAVVADAALFVRQSRPRLFIVGVHQDMTIPEDLTGIGPWTRPWHTPALKTAYEKLPVKTKQIWKLWKLPLPPKRKVTLEDIIEENPASTSWFSTEATRDLLAMMSDINRAIEQADSFLGLNVGNEFSQDGLACAFFAALAMASNALTARRASAIYAFRPESLRISSSAARNAETVSTAVASFVIVL